MTPAGWRNLRISGSAGRIAILVCFSSNLPPAMAADQPTVAEGHLLPSYVTGRVLADDGLPLSGPVKIETVCNFAAHAEGYAGPNGDFGFSLGDSNRAVMQDASSDWETRGLDAADVPANPDADAAPRRPASPRQEMANCEIRAVLAGYRSDTVSVDACRAFDRLNVGTIVLHRMGRADGHAISATSLAAPKDARTAFEKGQEALKKNKLDDAQKDFQKAVRAYPNYAAAWYGLGKLASDRGQFDDGLHSFQTAIHSDPEYVEPYLSVAVIQCVEQQWPQVAETTSELLRLDPYDYPQAYYMNALASYALKNIDNAEKSAREAERLDTQGRFPKVRRLLGVILGERRAFSEAAEQLRQYLQLAPQATDAATARTALTRLDALSGEAPMSLQRRAGDN